VGVGEVGVDGDASTEGDEDGDPTGLARVEGLGLGLAPPLGSDDGDGPAEAIGEPGTADVTDAQAATARIEAAARIATPRT
jgi:hypothetical protein